MSADSALLNGCRLFRHVGEKGFQVGSLVGLAIITPARLYRYGAEPKGILRTLGKVSLLTTSLALLLGAGKVASIPADERAVGLQDRAYRLHYNRGQNRVDLFSEIGMALGATGAMFLVSPAALVVLGGSAAGSAVGLLAHAATNTSTERS